MTDRPVSKVLVLDESPQYRSAIREFCESHDLVPVKVRRDAVMSVLKTNIDLGGILYSESYADSPAHNAAIARQIHAARPELPIIVRREGPATLSDLPESCRDIFCAAYTASDMASLRDIIGQYIFCLTYPNALLRGIADISRCVMQARGESLRVSMDTPFIVHDRAIFGEIFSLIHLESAWCRGYMMLQAQEAALLELLEGAAGEGRARPRYDGNDLLGEMTNLIWGAFKNRYIGEEGRAAGAAVQVPIIVNHSRKSISFGSQNPQLCFRFVLSDPGSGRAATIYQRFVFNLSFSPERFQEFSPECAGLVESGELQLF